MEHDVAGTCGTDQPAVPGKTLEDEGPHGLGRAAARYSPHARRL